MTAPTTTACVPCSNADLRGWWGPDHVGTHCRDCHRSWTGKTESHCASCCEHFSSPRVFDRHLEHCTADPTTARETYRSVVRIDGNPVFALTDRTHGPTWIEWDPREHFYGGAA